MQWNSNQLLCTICACAFRIRIREIIVISRDIQTFCYYGNWKLGFRRVDRNSTLSFDSIRQRKIEIDYWKTQYFSFYQPIVLDRFHCNYTCTLQYFMLQRIRRETHYFSCALGNGMFSITRLDELAKRFQNETFVLETLFVQRAFHDVEVKTIIFNFLSLVVVESRIHTLKVYCTVYL
jgi:hypothetical protein